MVYNEIICSACALLDMFSPDLNAKAKDLIQVVTGNTSGIGGAQIHEVTDVMDSEDPDIITNIFTVSEENESGVEQVPLLQTTTSREPEELAA